MSFSEQPKIVFNQMNWPIYWNYHEKSYYNLLSILFKPTFASVWVKAF